MIFQMFIGENTPENCEYAEKYANLCSDYDLGFLTDDQFEEELKKLNSSFNK